MPKSRKRTESAPAAILSRNSIFTGRIIDKKVEELHAFFHCTEPRKESAARPLPESKVEDLIKRGVYEWPVTNIRKVLSANLKIADKIVAQYVKKYGPNIESAYDITLLHHLLWTGHGALIHHILKHPKFTAVNFILKPINDGRLGSALDMAIYLWSEGEYSLSIIEQLLEYRAKIPFEPSFVDYFIGPLFHPTFTRTREELFQLVCLLTRYGFAATNTFEKLKNECLKSKSEYGNDEEFARNLMILNEFILKISQEIEELAPPTFQVRWSRERLNENSQDEDEYYSSCTPQ